MGGVAWLKVPRVTLVNSKLNDEVVDRYTRLRYR